MKKFCFQGSAIVALILFSLACSDKKEAPVTTPTDTQKPAKPEKPVVSSLSVADGEPIAKETVVAAVAKVQAPEPEAEKEPEIKRLDVPNGVNCDAVFNKDDWSHAYKNNETYMSPTEFFAVAKEAIHVFAISVAFMNGELVFLIRFIHEKTMCVGGDEVGASLAVATKGEKVFKLKAAHKRNCGTAKKVQQANGAAGLFTIPVNSLFFKKALTDEPHIFVFDDKTKAIGALFIDKKSAPELQNVLRCAYDAISFRFDLRDDKLLIDNTATFGK